jgi:dTDP-4-amino-4,6-dideoxygalactose transaminase
LNVFNSLGSNYDASSIRAAFLGAATGETTAAFTSYLQKRYQGPAHLTYKGREALKLSLDAAGLAKGSVVAITGFTCYAVYRAVETAGYAIEYLDIDSDTLNFTAETLEKALLANPQIRAVIVQNTLGNPCDIAAIEAVCKVHRLVLIEDLAHSAGARYPDGREAGTVGDLVMLSFGRDKVVDAVAGGALVVRAPELQHYHPEALPAAPRPARLRDRLYPILAAAIRSSYPLGMGRLLHAGLKSTGLLSKSTDGEYYTGHAMSDWQAALAHRRFEALETHLSHRRSIASIYQAELPESLQLTGFAAQANSGTNLRYPILVPDRSKLLESLGAHGIHVSDTWYDSPVAPPRYLSKTNYQHQCPSSGKVCAQIVNLPTHQQIDQETARTISKVINQCLKSQ